MIVVKCKGLRCAAFARCPLNHRAVEDLQINLVKIYDCEELVMLYQKFQEIGKFIKEEKIVNEI